MSICKSCKLEMNDANGCLKTPIKTTSGNLDPIPYGSEIRFDELEIDSNNQDIAIENDRRCHDCGALPGHYHHYGCDWEECPRCHEQLIGCDCEIDPTLWSRLGGWLGTMFDSKSGKN